MDVDLRKEKSLSFHEMLNYKRLQHIKNCIISIYKGKII